MKNNLSSKLTQFIHKYKLISQKMVVAVSGGVDSMVLLDLLCKLAHPLKLKLVVAHVHHGWRPQSDLEYDYIEKFCLNHAIEFYGTRLNLSKTMANAENCAREQRYTFFKQVYDDTDSCALLLAHHKGDLEETVIKRIYEGAFFMNLAAMAQNSQRLGMNIFRPLLDETKQELIDYAGHQSIKFFNDETNCDTRFLRARLRTQYFPKIQEIFGKHRGDNLIELARQAEMMKDFFEFQYARNVLISHPGALNRVFFLKNTDHIFETMQLVMLFFKKQGLTLPKVMIQSIAEVIQNSIHPKRFNVKSVEITASKGFMLLESRGLSKQTLSPEWIILENQEGCLAKLPAWFYKKFPALRHHSKNFLSSCGSFVSNCN